MDHLNAHLTTITRDHENYTFCTRVACGLAQKTLNKYYSLTDASNAYCIAMGKCSSIYRIY